MAAKRACGDKGHCSRGAALAAARVQGSAGGPGSRWADPVTLWSAQGPATWAAGSQRESTACRGRRETSGGAFG